MVTTMQMAMSEYSFPKFIWLASTRTATTTNAAAMSTRSSMRMLLPSSVTASACASTTTPRIMEATAGSKNDNATSRQNAPGNARLLSPNVRGRIPASLLAKEPVGSTVSKAAATGNSVNERMPTTEGPPGASAHGGDPMTAK